MNFTIDNATRHATALVQRPYQRRDGIYDEMVGLGTEPGAAWQPILSWFAHNDPNTQATFSRRVERLVFEHFYDPQRAGQGWHLDLMPLVLDTDAWSQIENAAIQRAVLFNHLLTDLYGAQVSFAEGLLPPTLIHSDRSFLRPLHGLSNSSQLLTFLALDFARDLAGNWRIIDAHTETPAGHGFALANRMVVADVLEDLFRKANATRIGPFYQALKNDLIQRAGSADPLIVVLAPGPKDSAFIGHAYMARYMGHKRVQGSDLRVMGNRVFLKTIDGLKEVDLIVRAIEGHKADPLELSEDSFDGPVGLVEACRQAPDVMVNALGTAVVENRGLSGYLNGLSQRFLGEDLLVPDTPRLWLGDAAAREQVLRELDQHVIHDAQEGTGSPGAAASGRMASAMTDAERAKLIEDITFNGNDLVAERQVGFATAPAWTHAGLRPEPYALRVYVAAIGSEFAVMPGGLALSVDEGATVALTSQRSRSRDVWVVSPTKSQPNISLVRLAKKNVRIQRRAQGLESRTADNLFWLGRYVEHADGTLRIIRQTLQRRAADLMALSASPRPIRALQAILQKDSAVPQAAGVNSPSDGLWSALHELCANDSRSQGLPATFQKIKDIGLQTRDRLSEDTWRLLSGLSADALKGLLQGAETDAAPTLLVANAIDIVEETENQIDRLVAFSGMTHENMTRSRAYLFLDLGRRIERALQLATLLKSLFAHRDDEALEGEDMIFALQAADSLITFRSRYRFAPELHLVLDLLVIDEMNPRSLAFQLANISEHIGQLPKSSDDAMRSPDQRIALDLLTKVRLADVEVLTATAGDDATRPHLCALLDDLISELPVLTQVISRHYFSLADDQPQRLHGYPSLQ